jgi:hypothetical protein
VETGSTTTGSATTQFHRSGESWRRANSAELAGFARSNLVSGPAAEQRARFALGYLVILCVMLILTFGVMM